MRVNRSMPAAAIIPVVEYPDVPAAMKWLEEAFGFEIRLRIGAHRGSFKSTCLDPAGHCWTFSETIANVDPADWGSELESSSPI
jgi:hypothetical protein